MSDQLDIWKEFVDFAYAKKAEHEWLFPAKIDKDVFSQMLAFHCHHKNLNIIKGNNDWAFVVFRPIKHAFDVDFNWEQPDSNLYLLDFLYSKCKYATLELWNMFCARGVRPSSILYYRRGKPKPFTPKLVLKFFHSALVKE
jgi:hypothetical protein